jgi:SAM-dependent methyltransferase
MEQRIMRKLSSFRDQVFGIQALKQEADDLKQKCASLEMLLEQCDYLPLPPTELRVRVGGWEDPDHFLGVGRKIYWDLKRLSGNAGRHFHSFHSILDFGCGCGRVTRYLRKIDGRTVFGTDIDPECIQWCKEYLSSIATFTVNDVRPPLAFPDESLDLVYGISVFTHLPEEMQFQWLEELRRVIKKGGMFITSVHGEGLLDPADREGMERVKKDGFLYIKGGGTPGLPDFYQTAYHTKAYIQKTWSRYFDILNIQTRAINNHQDGVVCIKRES